MNKELVQVKQEGVLQKIKKWFLRIFRKEKTIENQDTLNNTEGDTIQRAFIENIKVENNDKILILQRKIKEKQMEISDLTDEELDNLIELYKAQIEEKKEKLKKARKRLLDN